MLLLLLLLLCKQIHIQIAFIHFSLFVAFQNSFYLLLFRPNFMITHLNHSPFYHYINLVQVIWICNKINSFANKIRENNEFCEWKHFSLLLFFLSTIYRYSANFFIPKIKRESLSSDHAQLVNSVQHLLNRM